MWDICRHKYLLYHCCGSSLFNCAGILEWALNFHWVLYAVTIAIGAHAWCIPL
ncbi:hypothetical protein BDV35DRAFT_360312 [Aspergillus flavus]|uniref:Uncharacterized protein n=1 Tax=Aspergillus flavus TaxID=5059 RepID=A0A5N6GUX8_ASPFL|nr:hypothetical protein BDV35DRAFT_360312 [Aspergillus flavus]